MLLEFTRNTSDKHFPDSCWETIPDKGLEISDIDQDRVNAVIRNGINIRRIPDSASEKDDIESKLRHFGLIGDDGSLLNAATVLFCKNKFKIPIQCKLKLARFEGTNTKTFRDQTTIYGNIFEQYYNALDFCKKHFFLSGRMDAPTRIDTLTIPYDVLKEATINMLAHRNWAPRNMSPSIAIFDDRIEFKNPGLFPQGYKPTDFVEKQASIPRNPTIADVLYKVGLMESWGRGIAEIYDDTNLAGLPEPEYIETPAETVLIIRFAEPISRHLTAVAENKGQSHISDKNTGESTTQKDQSEDKNVSGSKLSDKVENILEIIRENPGSKSTKIAELSGLSKRSAERYIKDLKISGHIEYRGSAKTGGYYVK